MSNWEVIRNNTDEEQEVFDLEVTDAVNRFGRHATVWIDDADGTADERYPRGTRVDIYVRPGTAENSLTVTSGDTETITAGDEQTYRTVNVGGELDVGGELNIFASDRIKLFAGYVVESRSVNRQGADVVEAEVYSFDHFLRRNQIAEDLSDQLISDALETVITTYTPVDYDASQVTVVDDQTLTRSFRGKKVEVFLSAVASKSGNETFGVDDDLTFFFGPREAGPAPREIDNTQWLDYDLPEVGKEALNEVTVFYDDGNASVTVDRGDDKLDLQDSVGTNDPVELSEEVSKPDITNLEDARDAANEILDGREATLTGTVTSFDLYTAEPGQVIPITIQPRGIDGDFRIAELTWRWGEGTVELTIVEKRGNQDDLLVRMSDTLKQVELENVDREATGNRVTRTNVGVDIGVSGDVDGTGYDSAGITNDGRDVLRDGWVGEGNPTVADIAVGNDGTQFSRSDSALGNELARASVTETLPDAKTARYTADVSETDIREVGLFASDGTLLARATIPDTTLSSPVTVTIDATVSNDDDVSLGVITDAGQTAVRDILADNSPALPTQYAYGDDDSTPATTDTALGNQLATVRTDELLVEAADTDSEWANITTIEEEFPAVIDNGELTIYQSNFDREGVDFDSFTGTFYDDSDGAYSDGRAARIEDQDQQYRYDFVPKYRIPGSELTAYVRLQASDAKEVHFILVVDGSEYIVDELDGGESILLDWYEVGNGFFNASSGYTGPDVPAGSTVSFVIRATGTAGTALNIDVIATPQDDRFAYTFDNDNGGSGGYLDGPELYPDVARVVFADNTVRQSYLTATATQSWNNVSNNQYIELSNDGGSSWDRSTNTQSTTTTFGSSSTSLRAAVGISRYGSRTTATPQTGYLAQSVGDHEMTADVQAIYASSTGTAETQGVFRTGVLSGETLREAGQLDSNGNLLTRSVFADIDVLPNQRVLSNERVTVRNP